MAVNPSPAMVDWPRVPQLLLGLSCSVELGWWVVLQYLGSRLSYPSRAGARCLQELLPLLLVLYHGVRVVA